MVLSLVLIVVCLTVSAYQSDALLATPLRCPEILTSSSQRSVLWAARSSLFSQSNHALTSSSSAKTYTASQQQQLMHTTDSIEQLERDVTKVLHEIYPFDQDVTIPAVMRRVRLSFTNIWDLEDWKRHQSRWRYVRYIRKFATSRLLMRIGPQLAVVCSWAILASLIHFRFKVFNVIHIPLVSVSLLSTFVAALETLRSNQGLSRLREGRMAFGQATLLARDTAHLFASFVYPTNKTPGLLAARHLSLYMWLLKAQLRESSEDEVVRTMLPWKEEAAFVLHQRKKPVALLAQLRQITTHMKKINSLSQSEHMLIMQNLKGLDECIMTADRIRGTPIPPFYSSHAGRLTLFYLFFLPIALLGMKLSGYVATCVTAAISFAVLGLDEVSIMLEQPFQLMPLYQLSKSSMMDVADAFTCQPPPLSETEGTWTGSLAISGQDGYSFSRPTYW